MTGGRGASETSLPASLHVYPSRPLSCPSFGLAWGLRGISWRLVAIRGVGDVAMGMGMVVDDGVALPLGQPLGAVSGVMVSAGVVGVGVSVVVAVVCCHVSPPYAPAAAPTHSIYLHVLISDLSITRIWVFVSGNEGGSLGYIFPPRKSPGKSAHVGPCGALCPQFLHSRVAS